MRRQRIPSQSDCCAVRQKQQLPVVGTPTGSYHGSFGSEVKLHKSLKNKIYRWLVPLVYKHKRSLILVSLLLVAGGIRWAQSSNTPSERIAPRYIRFLAVVPKHDEIDPDSPDKRRQKQGSQDAIAAHVSRLDPNMDLYPSKRLITTVSKMGLARQEFIHEHSDDYLYGMRDDFETDECQSQYAWQEKSFPTCNVLHEGVDLSSIGRLSASQPLQRMLGHGYWRDVWAVFDGNRTAIQQSNTNMLVLKTMRYQHDFEDRNYDRHRRDAVAMERLSNSKMVVDIYGFCANSGLFEYATGGTLADRIWPKGSKDGDVMAIDAVTRLQLATQAAMGVAAIHNADKEGVPSMAHTDITPTQFVAVRPGFYKVNDFNRARFLRRNTTAGDDDDNKGICKYVVGRNPGKNRSPEEYKHLPQTEKVDVYSLGNLFYMLLTGLYPFEDVKDELEAQQQVVDGKRPTFPIEIWNATDPILVDLKEAMFACHEQEVADRATARQIESMLLQSLNRHDPTALQRWGVEEEYKSRVETFNYKR